MSHSEAGWGHGSPGGQPPQPSTARGCARDFSWLDLRIAGALLRHYVLRRRVVVVAEEAEPSGVMEPGP